MKGRFAGVALALVAMLALTACSRLSGKPAPGPEVPRPDSILDPVVLFNQNCAGCHGADGRKGPAMVLPRISSLRAIHQDPILHGVQFAIFNQA